MGSGKWWLTVIGGYCSLLEDVFMIFEDGFPSKSKQPFGRDFFDKEHLCRRSLSLLKGNLLEIQVAIITYQRIPFSGKFAPVHLSKYPQNNPEGIS